MLQYRLARAVDRPIPGLAGFSVRISDDLRKCVVFLGVHDDTPGKGGIHCAGTGFLLLYKKDAYLITAKHVAKEFDDGPFLVRVNKSGGGSDNLHGDQIRWFYHSNDDVDAAALPFFLSPKTWIRKQVYTGRYDSDRERNEFGVDRDR